MHQMHSSEMPLSRSVRWPYRTYDKKRQRKVSLLKEGLRIKKSQLWLEGVIVLKYLLPPLATALETEMPPLPPTMNSFIA